MANSTIKLADIKNPGLAPRLLTHVRDIDHASKNLPVSERAIARTYADEFMLPLLLRNVESIIGESIYSDLQYNLADIPFIQYLKYKQIATSGEYTWLSGSPSSMFVMTSGEPDLIYEDPKFFKTICQGGTEISGSVKLESTLRAADAGVALLSSSYNMLLAKTLIWQLSGMHPDDAYSIGTDSDKESIVKKFRFYTCENQSPTGAFYYFDQGDQILERGYYHGDNPSGEVVKLWHYNMSGALVPQSNLSGAVKFAQFFDIVDFSLFDEASGSYYGNGYVLGDGARPVEKLAICTTTSRVATFGSTVFNLPINEIKLNFSAAPKIGTNKVIIAKGCIWDTTLAYTTRVYDDKYYSYMIDSETKAVVNAGVGYPLEGGSTGFNSEEMIVFGGHRSEFGTAEIAPTLMKLGEMFDFNTETIDHTYSISIDAQREYAGCFSVYNDVFVFGGNGRIVKDSTVESIKIVPKAYVSDFNMDTETSQLLKGSMLAPRKHCKILRSASSKLSVVGGIGPICKNGRKSEGLVGLLEKCDLTTGTFTLDYPPLHRIAAQCCVQDQNKGWSVGGLVNMDGYKGYDSSWEMQSGEIETTLVQECNFSTGTWSITDTHLTNAIAYSASVQL